MSDLPVWIAVCDDDRKDLEKLSAMVKQILEKEKRPVHWIPTPAARNCFVC